MIRDLNEVFLKCLWGVTMEDLSLKPLRILYAAGPGNVIGTYKYWKEGQDDPSQLAVTYSSQFYDLCSALGAKGYLLSSCQERAFLQDDPFTMEHRPSPAHKASGILYHLFSIWYGLGLLVTAIRWKANVVVVADGTTHWFVLSPLPLLGIKVIPSLHCVLKHKFLPTKKTDQIIMRLNSFLLANSKSILAVSNEVSRQVRQIISNPPPLLEFLPVYRPEEFSQVTPPDPAKAPFRVVFIGRVEYHKGVFDLVEIAKRFATEGKTNVLFELCGSGPALEPLRYAVQQADLETYFVFHGYCNKTKLHQVLGHAHVIVAPTRTTFVEGFCKVIAEGILVGRPVLTSRVCPASSYVPSGVIAVEPDNVQQYGDALLKLYQDRGFYEEKRRGCLKVQEQFYDSSKSWGAALKLALTA